MYDYLIVGAGLFGSVFAEHAVRDGKKVLVIDKRKHVAGNCYTESINGIDVHRYGAHIFHTRSKDIWHYIRKFGFLLHYRHRVKANYKDRIYTFPINLTTLYEVYGVCDLEKALKALEADIEKSNGFSLEGFALRTVGRKVYEIFVKGYTEKQWGLECSELPKFILKRIPIRKTHDDSYFSDWYQGIPAEGYTRIIENMLNGAEVQTGCDYFDGRDKWDKMAKAVVYTGKIDEYFDYVHGKLDYRSLRFDTTTLSIKDYQGISVVNYTGSDIPYTRIIEHKHFNDRGTDNTIITREYPEKYDGNNVPYYPISTPRNNELFMKYKEMAKKKANLVVGGRLGSYKYYDMCDAISASMSIYKKFKG